jgi:alpha-1,3-mannosyltransferase
MNILQVCNHFHPCVGGVEKVVFDTSKLLALKGHKVKVICLNKCANNREKLPKTSIVEKISVERLEFLDLKYYKISPQIIKKIKEFDIIHIHGIGFFSDFLLATKFLHKKKIIISTHGGIFHTKNIGLAKWFYFNIIQRILLGFADKVIAVSKNDYEIFGKICKKITLIENGIVISKFKSGKKKPGTMLYLGRFSKNKRIELLINALANLKNENFKLTIAGTDSEGLFENYLKKAKELGIAEKIEFILNPGEKQVIELYSSSEFFISASEYEGFGISLVEAMASKCIPIVQNNSGFKSILSDFKNCLVDYSKPEEAAKAIKNMIKIGIEEKIKLQKDLKKKAENYSLEKNYEKIINAYQ